MTIDLFHQLVYEHDGYHAIRDYTKDIPQTDVFDSEDIWIGCTNISEPTSIRSNVKKIIEYHIKWKMRNGL